MAASSGRRDWCRVDVSVVENGARRQICSADLVSLADASGIVRVRLAAAPPKLPSNPAGCRLQ